MKKIRLGNIVPSKPTRILLMTGVGLWILFLLFALALFYSDYLADPLGACHRYILYFRSLLGNLVFLIGSAWAVEALIRRLK